MLTFEALLSMFPLWLSCHADENIKITVLYSGLLNFKDSFLIKFHLTEDILAATSW